MTSSKAFIEVKALPLSDSEFQAVAAEYSTDLWPYVLVLILAIEKLCKRICKGDDCLHGLLFSRVKAHHESKGSVDEIFEARQWRTR